jgi:nitronate monooxygenase
VGRSRGEEIRTLIHQIRELTDRPFAVNIFIPEEPVVETEKITQMDDQLRSYREELNFKEVPFKFSKYYLEEQMEVLLDENVPVVSYTFGALPVKWVEKLKQNGTIVSGTATNVREAIQLEKDGVDYIVGQGSEAGGHRGTFMGTFEHSTIGTMALIPQMLNHVNVPVVAAGGIMDGRGIVASMMLGASGVQMGTAFLTCKESGAHDLHKKAVLNSTEEQSVLTRMFSGKPARGIDNRFKREMENFVDGVPPYPIQDSMTKNLRDAASKQNNIDFMALWAGQGTRLSRSLTALQLIEKLISEAEKTINDFTVQQSPKRQ